MVAIFMPPSILNMIDSSPAMYIEVAVAAVGFAPNSINTGPVVITLTYSILALKADVCADELLVVLV
jgi:hypothetical protein